MVWVSKHGHHIQQGCRALSSAAQHARATTRQDGVPGIGSIGVRSSSLWSLRRLVWWQGALPLERLGAHCYPASMPCKGGVQSQGKTHTHPCRPQALLNTQLHTSHSFIRFCARARLMPFTPPFSTPVPLSHLHPIDPRTRVGVGKGKHRHVISFSQVALHSVVLPPLVLGK